MEKYKKVYQEWKSSPDVDKFYAMLPPVENRRDALEFSKGIKKSPFRAGLLVSFMWEHSGHSCTVFSEHTEHVFPVGRDDAKEDSDIFWEL